MAGWPCIKKGEVLPILERANLKLNMFRVFVRLSKDVRAIDSKKYVLLQENTDEVGRMLGSWIKSFVSIRTKDTLLRCPL